MKLSLYIFTVLIISLSCNNSSKLDNDLNNNSTISCANFILIESTNIKHNKLDVIDSSIVIAYFDMYDQINMYDKEGLRDSLPNLLKRPDRQLIYKTVDQFGYYQTFLKPLIDSLQIPIITNSNDSLISFDYENQFYTINITSLIKEDGLILYKAGQKPIYWRIVKNIDSEVQLNYIKQYYN